MTIVVNRICLCSVLLIVIICVPTVADVTSALNKTSGEPGYGAGYSVQQTSDGGYIITGTKYSDEPKLLSQMIWLIKTAPNGDQVWNRIFGGSHNDVGYSVQQTSDGYIIAGSTESFGAGGLDLWLIKTDVSGNEVWDRTFGGPGSTVGYSVQQTYDGGYIITGSKVPVAGITGEIWVIKTDANGTGGHGCDVNGLSTARRSAKYSQWPEDTNERADR